MIFGFGKKKARVRDEEEDDDEDREFVLFQGSLNGRNPDLSEHGRLVQAGLVAAKTLVTDALANRADTVLIEPKGKAAVVTFYVDGVAQAPSRIPGPAANAITQMLKLLAGLDIKLRDRPQSGGIKAEYGGNKYEIRVDPSPGEGGAERLMIRIQDTAQRLETPDDLGFSDTLRNKIRAISQSKSGLIVAAGPPNSGLTTATIGIVRGIDAYLYAIFCIADLHGRDLPHITMERRDPEDSLKETLVRLKRAEADVIFSTPITDAESARTTLEMAERACLVCELSARDAADGIVKLVQLSGDPALVANQLKLVVSQRLIRVLCTRCRQAYRPNPKLLAQVGLPPETKVLYRPPRYDEEDEPDEECPRCRGTGYYGRTGIIEFIEMTEGMKEVIKGGGNTAAIRAQARKEKMQSFQSDAIRLVAEGRTALEELQRAFSVK